MEFSGYNGRFERHDVGAEARWIRASRARFFCLSAAAASLIGLSLTGCDGWWDAAEGLPSSAPYINIVAAEQQPQASNDGVILYVQAAGGNYVSLSASGGTLGTGAPDGSCLPTVAGGIPIQVIPASGEAVVWGYLYQLDAGPPDAGGCGPTGKAIKRTVKVVTDTSNGAVVKDAGLDVTLPKEASTDGPIPSMDGKTEATTSDAGKDGCPCPTDAGRDAAVRDGGA